MPPVRSSCALPWCTMRRVGDLDLSELAAVRRSRGHDELPYPFAHTRKGAHRADHQPNVSGELSDWVDAYLTAEVWVSCRVHHSDPTSADGRLLAYLSGTTAYLASQRDTEDVVDVSSLASADLGAAVADSIGLTGPGRREQIVIPGYVGYFTAQAATEFDCDDYDHPVRISAGEAPHADVRLVADDDVTALATIESRWQPPRNWGTEWTGNTLACVQIGEDGDYLYTPDFAYAVPVSRQALGNRIGALIARDHFTILDGLG